MFGQVGIADHLSQVGLDAAVHNFDVPKRP